MDENERKRKRELGIAEVDEEEQNQSMTVDDDQLDEGARQLKKRRTDTKQANANAQLDPEEQAARNKAKAEKRKEKRDRKKEKVEKKKEKAEAKKTNKQAIDLDGLEVDKAEADSDAEDDEDTAIDGMDDVDDVDVSGLADASTNSVPLQDSSVPTSPEVGSPAFDISANHSAASSSSSIVPPTMPPSSTETTSDAKDTNAASTTSKKDRAFNLPKVNQEEMQARLRARIEELRARRKADGADGKPAQSRQELLDERRKKQEARKQHKKELRLKAKQEEERLNNERLRGSGSPLSADIFSPRSPMERENNFSFGRVAFEDGQEALPTLNGTTDVRRKKGPQDPKTAFDAAQKKAARLSGYDETKRADIQEKDAWLNAKKRAHGERVRDDTSLLKKALKRKEKTKLKSEKEWNERIDGVKKGQEFRQKKREENLAKRKEGKGSGKGKSKGGAKGGKPSNKKKGRPGFEGKR